jgi:hypothetical protein
MASPSFLPDQRQYTAFPAGLQAPFRLRENLGIWRPAPFFWIKIYREIWRLAPFSEKFSKIA